MLTSVQVVETPVNFTTNSPSQEYTHPDDHTSPTYVSPPVQKGRLDYQPLFGKMSPHSSPRRGGTKTGLERAAEIEPTERPLSKAIRTAKRRSTYNDFNNNNKIE